MALQDGFDPYRKWLGIPETEFPPSLYRLLGLVDFESDVDVISHAADRCMAHVRTFQTGAYSELSQRILNELAQARNCLLDPARRQAYDLELRRQRMAAPPAVARPVGMANPMAPVAVAPLSGLPGAAAVGPAAYPIGAAPGLGSATGILDAPLPGGGRNSSVTRRVRRKSSPVPVLMAMVAGVIALGLGVIVWNQIDPPASKSEKPSATTPTETPKSYVIKRQRPTEDSATEILQPLDGEAAARDNPRRTGAAPVVDVRSSSERTDRWDRENPTTVADALEATRASMARGNPFRAKRMLEIAATLSPNEEQQASLAALGKLQGYFDNFHRALAAGAAKLEPGRTFLIDLGSRQIPASFVEFEGQNSRRLVFESEGRRMTFRLDSLPADWAMPIARPMLDTNSPGARLAMATFLALAANGDRELAARMWETLFAEGVADASLAGELQLSLSEKTAGRRPSPASEMPEKPAETMPENAPAAGETWPAPTGEVLAEARRKFREQYREQLSKARSADDKGALAVELGAKAAETEDSAMRFVMLQQAVDLVVEQGNPAEFLRLIDELAAQYEVDPLAAKTDALVKSGATLSGVDQGETLYLATSDVYATAKEFKRHDLAERLARLAVKCAERAGDREAAAFAESEARRMQSLHQLVASASVGQETLRRSPDDAAALTAVGRWECFLNNNWGPGLEMLQKGNDAPLAELAQADLASPSASPAQVELADRWLKYGKAQREGLKAGPFARATHWYEQALDGASDDVRAAIEKSLAEAKSLLEGEG